MASPHRTAGSLCPAFAPARPVRLPVKHPYAIALYGRLPFVLSGTLGSLRYSFGGDHPSQTTHQTVSPLAGLELKYTEGQYFNVGSTNTGGPRFKSPAYPTHPTYPNSALSYSKGSRGLFVPLRVDGIFTGTTISPSSRLRQCPDRYTIRAGRNLPDKEFRYLRTVIVTAAVYWGFDSMLLLR